MSKPWQKWLAARFQFEKVKDKNDYDDYFHLNLNVTLDNGVVLTVEKNEVINIKKGAKLTSKSETMEVTNPPENTTLQQLMDRTREHQGKKYFLYKCWEILWKSLRQMIIRMKNMRLATDNLTKSWNF